MTNSSLPKEKVTLLLTETRLPNWFLYDTSSEYIDPNGGDMYLTISGVGNKYSTIP